MTAAGPWGMLAVAVSGSHGEERLSMDPSAQFCPHPVCDDKGRVGTGNIGIQS